ncbi:MAG: TonB-dependent receptor plug domain-containing protein [Dehalococcoidia bacterium]
MADHASSRFGLRYTVLALLLAPWTAAHADVLGEATEFDVVTVTAQKRAENLQDVPIAVTAIGAEALAGAGVRSTFDVAQLAPNVQFQDAGSIQVLNIRGVTLIDPGDANEPPVGIYVDDVYQGAVGGHSAALFDLERVEVLRGPQGTLYGRNTTAGLGSVQAVWGRPRTYEFRVGYDF